tara:strand:+ start:172 stop:294 length:123 start_codon:yes stop_codon:yes gene_type:complete
VYGFSELLRSSVKEVEVGGRTATRMASLLANMPIEIETNF